MSGRDGHAAAGEIEISVNGESRAVGTGTTIAGLLAGHDVDPDHVVVERNGEIVGRAAYGDTVLESGDALEIVTFVGGG